MINPVPNIQRQVEFLAEVHARQDGTFESLEWRVRAAISELLDDMSLDMGQRTDLYVARREINELRDRTFIRGEAFQRPQGVRMAHFVKGVSVSEFSAGLPGLGKGRP